jgi:hypothetical protein
VIVRSMIKIQSAAGEREIPVVWGECVATLTTPPCEEPGHQGPPTEEVVVPKVQAAALNQGAFVNRALTSVDVTTREWFTSGYCPRCWDRLFGG